MVKNSNEVSKIISDSGKTFTGRSKIYGEAYKNIGPMMKSVFPEGVTLLTEGDFSRFYALLMTMNKMNRYASRIESGGHQDSAHDAVVYSAMLESFTGEE